MIGCIACGRVVEHPEFTSLCDACEDSHVRFANGDATFQSEWDGILRVIDMRWNIKRAEFRDAFHHQAYLIGAAQHPMFDRGEI